MASSSEMKTGETYVCKDCGIEMQVTKQCETKDTSGHACGCHSAQRTCTITCCGKDMQKA